MTDDVQVEPVSSRFVCMNQNSGISFLIPAYNCAHHLRDAVCSILHGNCEAGDEILVVDDGSTDGTWVVAEKLATTEPRIKLLRHRYNKGSAGAARNTAIDAARHDLFFCLDSDNLLLPGSIAPLKEYMIAAKADVAAFAEVRFFSTTPDCITHVWTYPTTTTLADALGGHIWPGPDGNYLLTRESWQRAGRYDEAVGGAIDSWAFGISQLVVGCKMVAMPRSAYLHRWGHDSAWIRGQKQGRLSLNATRVLLPHLHLLEDDSISWLLSAVGRNTWFDQLEQRPLKLKGDVIGAGGTVTRLSVPKDPFIKRLRRVLARLIAPRE